MTAALEMVRSIAKTQSTDKIVDETIASLKAELQYASWYDFGTVKYSVVICLVLLLHAYSMHHVNSVHRLQKM